MFPNRFSSSNDNIDSKFLTKSTPKKPQNNTNDISDKKLSLDVMYSELQFLKEENIKSCNDTNNRLDKLENDFGESSFRKFDEYRAEEQRNKGTLSDLEKRVSNMEKHAKKTDNALATLTNQLAAIQIDITTIKTIQSQFSSEDLIRSCVSEYSRVIQHSIDQHMDKIGALISDVSVRINNNIDTQISINRGDEMRPNVTLPSKEIAGNNSISTKRNVNNSGPINVNPTPIEQKSNNNNLFKIPDNAPLKESPKPPIVNNLQYKTTKESTNPSILFGSTQGSNSFLTGLQTSNLFDGNSPFMSPVNDSKSKDSTNPIFSNKPLFSIDPSNNSSKPNFGLSWIANPTSQKQSGEFLFGNKPPSLFAINTTKPTSNSENMPIFGAGSDGPSFDGLSAAVRNSGDSSVSQIDLTGPENIWKGGCKLFSNYADNVNSTHVVNDESGELHNAEEERELHFQPIIELPPLITVEKDEDSSDVLFKSRCKLYKYTDGEWKERGVGEMKILQTKGSVDKSKPVRLLMRREQVRKICCNQRVTKTVPSFTEMSNEKSVCWIGNDFSDGSSVTEQFAIRFSQVDILKQFKEIIKNIQDAFTEE